MTSAESIQAFAGIDGGASKTRARVVDVDGHVIGEGVAGPGSLTLSPETAAANCRRALHAALAGSGMTIASCRLVCGMAGHRHPGKRKGFEQGVAGVGSLEVISDGYAALLGAHRGAPGAIVITGTGSVALRLDADGIAHQIGGFGPVVGDEGGGNWLGREAVRAALRALDEVAAGERELSPFAAALISFMGGHHEAILDWIAAADATRFAALVPLIVHHETNGDRLAKHLLDAAAKEAGRLVRLVGRDGALPVSLLGGLSTILEPRLSTPLRAHLTEPVGDALDGALLRARDRASPEVYG